MNENEKNTLSQESPYQWLQSFSNNCAIQSGALLLLVFSFHKYAYYLLSFMGSYEVDSIPILPVMLTTIGLLLSASIIEFILWKLGIFRPIRSGIWLGTGIGPLMGILMFERGRTAPEFITIAVVVFALTFVVVYLLDSRKKR